MKSERPELTVNNWRDFQHYKDRDPVWIKAYTRLLRKYEWCSLSDASKGHLFGIWLLASDTKGVVTFDPEWIAGKISASTPIDFEALCRPHGDEATSGWLTPNGSAAAILADRYDLTVAARPHDARKRAETALESTNGHGPEVDIVRKLLRVIAPKLRAPEVAYVVTWLKMAHDDVWKLCAALCEVELNLRNATSCMYVTRIVHDREAAGWTDIPVVGDEAKSFVEHRLSRDPLTGMERASDLLASR